MEVVMVLLARTFVTRRFARHVDGYEPTIFDQRLYVSIDGRYAESPVMPLGSA